MSTSVPTLHCPQGHGEFPADAAIFCMTCGARLVAAVHAGGPAPSVQAAAAAPAAYPGPGGPMPGQPAQGFVQPPQATPQKPPSCATCGGVGWGLPPTALVCPACNWLRPLVPGYTLHPSAFMWAQDAAAMQRLRAIGPLTAAARAVSDKVGRRWVEATFNAIRLGENQLPHVYSQAVEAARLVGMPSMPEVYVSGDRMWEALTYGSDNSAFVIVGTALIGAFRGPELLYVLAREMGHCRAGHALWKTVGTFLLGQQGPRKSVMAGGVLAALNPQKIVEGALDIPLLAWARQSEITADRAGLLAVGDEEAARRVLLSWSLKSVGLYSQINIDAWLSQQHEDSEDQMSRIAEMVTSPTPYITNRLALLSKFARSPEMQRARAYIAQYAAPQPPAGQPAAPQRRAAAGPRARGPAPSPAGDVVRLKCPHCGADLSVPKSSLAGKDEAVFRCGNPACGRPVPLRRRQQAAPAGPAPAPAAPAAPAVPVQSAAPAASANGGGGPRTIVAMPDASGAASSSLRVPCPACKTVMAVPREAVEGSESVRVRCPNAECRKVTSLRLRRDPGPAAERTAPAPMPDEEE